MVVSGLIVNTLADRLEHVKGELLKIEGIEINNILDDDKIVVVVELKSIEGQVEVSKKIMNIEGVFGVNIAYHHFGDDEQV